jgi:hypothetical protein
MLNLMTAQYLLRSSTPNGEDARRAGTKYGFEHNYHTTLVTALAAFLHP